MQKQIRCLYEVLGLTFPTDDVNEIKKAYKRAALQYHPDKNAGEEDQEMVNERFREVQEAFRVLSDKNEKAWYDEHREDILRGGQFDGSAEKGEDGEGKTSNLPNLWRFFSTSCYSGFDDKKPNNFYAVYDEAFRSIWECEPVERREEAEYCSFGDSASPWKRVGKFYAFWSAFATQASFSWADKWRVPDGESRDIRRQMKKENDKLRSLEKKKYVEQVRKLVGFVKGMDQRVMVEKQRAQKAAEADKKEKEERKKSEKQAALEARRAAAAEQDVELDEEAAAAEKAFWEKFGEGGNVVEKATPQEEDEEEEVPENYCQVCRMEFRTPGQYNGHLGTKKHKSEVAKLRKELAVAGEELSDDLKQILDQKPQDTPPKKQQGGKKKKNKDAEEEKVAEDTIVVEETAEPEQEEIVVAESEEKKAPKTKKKRRAANKGKQSQGLSCKECGAAFPSRSKLFQHLEEEGHAKPL